jgi:hypothetical protein
MPTVMNAQEVTAFAHCGRPTCDGYDQQPVPAKREEIGYTYLESGGDLPHIEKSSIQLTFADPDDMPCPHCGRQRELTADLRAEYQNLSGYDPEGLVGIKYGKQERNVDTEYEAPK